MTVPVKPCANGRILTSHYWQWRHLGTSCLSIIILYCVLHYLLWLLLEPFFAFILVSQNGGVSRKLDAFIFVLRVCRNLTWCRPKGAESDLYVMYFYGVVDGFKATQSSEWSGRERVCLAVRSTRHHAFSETKGCFVYCLFLIFTVLVECFTSASALMRTLCYSTSVTTQRLRFV